MPPLDPTQAAALQRPAVMLLHALQWDLPGGDPLCFAELHTFAFLVDGVSRTFSEVDSTFGALGSIGEVQEGVTDEIPEVGFTIYTPSNTAMAILTNPAIQGSRVRIWVPILDPASGLVLGSPRCWFDGWSDVAVNQIDEKQRVLAVTAKSRLARYKIPNEGIRLNNGTHQTYAPGELGMQYSSSLSRQVPWGSSTPASPLDKSQQANPIWDLGAGIS